MIFLIGNLRISPPSTSKRGTIGGFGLPRRTLHEGGRMLVEQVAGSPWNGWPDAHGIRGRITVVRAARVEKHPELHLSVSMRSFRAERLSAFVGAVLDGDAQDAHALYLSLQGKYPLWVTRDLGEARAWLRSVARGTERTGLVASSGGHRLRPEGIYVKAPIDPANWFLNDKRDVRSSFYLEEVATEFSIQGLELDWVGLCWDADFRREAASRGSYAFRGNVWNSVRDNDRQRFLKNAYRVLMTRARQGMVIYLPVGDDRDRTRPCSFYDRTYAFLRTCGLPDASTAMPLKLISES